MGTGFWVRRFLLVFATAFVVIAASHLLRGRGTGHALTEAAPWGFLSAAVFVAASIHRARNGRHCALCRDTPEMRPPLD